MPYQTETTVQKYLHRRGCSLATIVHILSKLYMFGLSRRFFATAKATGFNFGTFINQVTTNHKTEIYP